MDCGSDIWSRKSTFVNKLWNVSLFLYFFAYYSSTILIIMSVEKWFVLYFPFKAKVVCTLRTARWASLISAVLLIAFETNFSLFLNLMILMGLKFACILMRSMAQL